MEDERNTQYHQSGESKEKADDQVEVKERSLLETLLGRKKPEDQEKKQEEALVSGMENVKVSEPEKHDVKEERHEGGEKKESLLAKLHRTGFSSSSSSDEEEEVIDENGEVVKRKKKKGLKEKIKEKLPGHKDHEVEGEHKPYAPAPAQVHQEAEHKPYVPPQAPASVEAHHDDNAVVFEKVEETPEQGLLDKIKEKLPGGHKKPEDASAAHPPAPHMTTTHVHHDDSTVVVQKVEETPEKGLLDKIKEKLPGGHKKPEDASAAHPPAAHAEDVSSPDGKDKKQGLLGKIMDKIPGYNKSPAEEEHNKPSAAGEHKTSS